MSRYFSSYKSLFKIKFKIYSIGKHQLARPIPIDTLGIFAILFLPSYFLSGFLSGIVHTNRIAASIAVDLFLTSVAHKIDPQGRPFMEFIYDLVRFIFRPKRRDFNETVKNSRRQKLRWEALDLDFDLDR